MTDETASGPFTSGEREAFYYQPLDDARFDPPMLHEPLWDLNERYPAATQRDRDELVQATLLELFDRGFIELFELGDRVPLERERARSLILGDTWRALPVVAIFEFGTTPAGEKAHGLVPDGTWDRVFPDRLRHASNPDRA